MLLHYRCFDDTRIKCSHHKSLLQRVPKYPEKNIIIFQSQKYCQPYNSYSKFSCQVIRLVKWAGNFAILEITINSRIVLVHVLFHWIQIGQYTYKSHVLQLWTLGRSHQPQPIREQSRHAVGSFGGHRSRIAAVARRRPSDWTNLLLVEMKTT